MTDLLLHERNGIVERKPEYTVVRTPDAPQYFFGNMLVLSGRPTEQDVIPLESLFAKEIGIPPTIKHQTFMWPDSETQVSGHEAYIKAGYASAHNCVMIAQRSDLISVVHNSAVLVRKYQDQADWDDWTAMHLADGAAADVDETYQCYLSHQQAAYRNLISLGLGDWWGAYIEGEQVASAGLFYFQGIGRFQSVITAEAYRNRNICKTLLNKMAAAAFYKVDKLVIVSDEGYFAGSIYKSLGFHRHQWTGSLCRHISTEF
jgi:hypothetical protein